MIGGCWTGRLMLAGGRRKSRCWDVDVPIGGFLPSSPPPTLPPLHRGYVLKATTPSPSVTDGAAGTSCRSSKIMVDQGPANVALCILPRPFLFPQSVPRLFHPHAAGCRPGAEQPAVVADRCTASGEPRGGGRRLATRQERQTATPNLPASRL